MRYHIITIFPDMFDSYLTQSILGQAMNAGIIEVTAYDLRSYSEDKHRRVDGRVYGGGPGMVMWVDPIMKCYEDVVKSIKKRGPSPSLSPQGRGGNANAVGVAPSLEGRVGEGPEFRILVVIFTPEKVEFNNLIAENVSKEYSDIIFICGRYEGIDARVKLILEDLNIGDVVEWSVGPYVLTGGELPAMICIDAISRRLPGVLNNENSIEENRVSSHEIYGRPEVYDGYKVPEVLLSGHHANIEKWKEER